MKEIKLTQGKVALVDDADYEWLSQWKWCAHKQPKGEKFYAVRGLYLEDGTHHSIRMHRQILNASEGTEVDHIDCNGLNNQRSNLRLATRSQNEMNKVPWKKNKTSKYKGVHYCNTRRKYVMGIRFNNSLKRKYHTSEIDAAQAYDELARIHHGEFARLNFPNK